MPQELGLRSSSWPNLRQDKVRNEVQALGKIENQESKTIVNTNVHLDRDEEERSVPAYSRMLSGTQESNAIIRKSPFCNYQNKDGISKNHQWMLNPGGNVRMNLKSLP